MRGSTTAHLLTTQAAGQDASTPGQWEGTPGQGEIESAAPGAVGGVRGEGLDSTARYFDEAGVSSD